MINEIEPDLDRAMGLRWGTKADDVRVQRTIAALEANGISALRAADLALQWGSRLRASSEFDRRLEALEHAKDNQELDPLELPADDQEALDER